VSPRRGSALGLACLVAGGITGGFTTGRLALGAGPRADRVVVPAGPSKQGSTKGEEDERPERMVVLKAFAIDRTEVTRAAYGACVAARHCKAPRNAAAGKAPPVADTGASEADPQLPVTGVSWADAQAYCRFAGGRLPTEAEWEKAARGPDGREYPWGDEPDCARANWGSFEGEGPCAGRNPGRPTPVGRYPTGASVYGALDLGGNVWEWVADKYDEDPTRRVVRGGSCCSYFVGPRAANRNAWAPEHRDGDLGFRCAGKP
jgi:formylglycine-generating enzyme required for sulfatase activity